VLKAEIGAAYVNLADERSVAYLQQALDELNPATHAKETGAALLWLGRYYHLRAQYTQALIHLEQARTLIEPLDDAPTLGLFYGSMAIVLMYSGRFAESMSWARRGIALSEAKNDMHAIVLGYLYLSENSEYRGHWRDTQAFAARGHLFARQSGWHNMEVWIELERLVVAYYQGDLVAARQLARDCVASATELDERRAVLHTNKLLILIETALGHEEPACRIGEQAVRDVDDVVGVGIRCWIRLALAGLYMQREEYPRAVALYEQCADMLAGTENRVLQMELGAPLAEAYGAHGRMAEASQVIVETLELTRACGARHYEAVAWRVQGQISAAQGLHDDAVRAFDQALALCEELGSQLEEAHVLYQRGLLYQMIDDADLAHADWTRARMLCEQMSARALLWRIHAALGQLALVRQHPIEAEYEFAAARAIVEQLATDMRDESFRENLRRRAAALIPAAPLVVSRRAVKAEFDGLTERERAVAALIARGHSNRAIAEQLVVSERTITTHVSNILSKLGFSSRAQVARWASEKGMAGLAPD
jgi:ATP/maltotriose-dependent transcriptional regulator MalT